MRARLLPLLAVACAAPAWAAELNVISSIEIKDTGPEVVLSVNGSRKPSFTTFAMADPPRFVIDFSEAKFQGVPEETAGSGIVKQVKALSYGSGASAIARVMIAFTAEVDPPAVEDSGNTLVVRVAKPGGAGAAVASDAEAKAKADADAEAKAKADTDAKVKAAAEAQAAEEKRQAQAKADADAKAQAKADADAKIKAAVEAQARADEEKRQAQAQADADAKAQAKADADAKAKAEADAQAKAAEAAASDEGEADQKALEAEIAAARSERAAEAGKAARPAAKAEKAPDVAVASAGIKPRAAKQDLETLSPVGPVAHVREVGFRQLPEASRVFVRTSSPAEFSIQDVDDRTVRIQLQNTRAIRHNDLRFLDTSFFPSAVQLITPSREGSSYVLTVRLRERVPYQQVKDGDLVAVDFQRPPSTAAATPPPGDAPDSGAPGDSSQE